MPSECMYYSCIYTYINMNIYIYMNKHTLQILTQKKYLRTRTHIHTHVHETTDIPPSIHVEIEDVNAEKQTSEPWEEREESNRNPVEIPMECMYA